MQKFMLKDSPKVYDWRNSEECEELFVDEWDLEKVKALEPDAVFYWYVTGSYEGSGALIAVKDGKWYTKDLGHCSCYGPLDDFATDISEYTKGSLDELLESGSDDWKKEYAPLVELARSHGYK